MITYKRFLITWFDMHGRRHNASRHVSLKRLLNMGIGC
jgi:hypothetical protein